MKEAHYTVATPADFAPVITAVLQKAALITDQAALVTLTGDLGAGKTTFTQQLAKHLGVVEPVVSPTFGIMKSYDLRNHPLYDHLVHIDAYRVEDISETGPLRLVEVFAAPGTLICLEWPEQIAEILPKEKIEVVLVIEKDDVRLMTVQ